MKNKFFISFTHINMIKQLLVIGDATIDNHVVIEDASVECNLNKNDCKLCLDFAAKIPMRDSFQATGGNGVNVSLGTARLGIDTMLLTSLGDDNNKNIILEELRAGGVDTSLITIDKNAPTRNSTILNFQGERTILAFHHKRQYDWPKNEPKVNWIYFTGLSEGFENLKKQLDKYLHNHPTVRLALNPGSFQLKNHLEDIREMLSKTDLLIVNKEEAEKILGTTLKKEKTLRALVHELINMGVKEVAITDASRGATAGDEEEVYEMESYPVTVTAKTGAGDAFSAGYLAARINHHDIPNCLTWGVANSCSVIQKTSSHLGLLSTLGIKKMINTYSKIKPKKIY